MNQKKNPLSQEPGSNHFSNRQHRQPPSRPPVIMQPKMATEVPVKKPPVAPRVNRLQPAPGAVQLMTAQAGWQNRKQPLTPSVNRPQPTPHVLQTKSASAQPSQAGALSRQPVAPPVNRPQPVPKVLQKKAVGQPSQTVTPPRRPVAPPVYRPQAKPIVQPKMAATGQAPKSPQSPPVYRPQPVPKVLQGKIPASHNGERGAQGSAFNAWIPAAGNGQAAIAGLRARASGGTVVQRVIGPGGSRLHGSPVSGPRGQVGEITMVVAEQLDNGSEVNPTYRVRFPDGRVSDVGAQTKGYHLLLTSAPTSGPKLIMNRPSDDDDNNSSSSSSFIGSSSSISTPSISCGKVYKHKEVAGLTLEQLAKYQQNFYVFRSLNEEDLANLCNGRGLSPLGSGEGPKFFTRHIKQTGVTGMISVSSNPGGSRGFQSGAIAVINLAGLKCFSSDELTKVVSRDTSATGNNEMNIGKASESLVCGAIPFKNIICWSRSSFPVDTSHYEISKTRRDEVRVVRPGKKNVKFTKGDQTALERLEAKLLKDGSLKTKEMETLTDLRARSAQQKQRKEKL